MTMMLAPSKAVLAGEKDDKPAEGEPRPPRTVATARQNGTADAAGTHRRRRQRAGHGRHAGRRRHQRPPRPLTQADSAPSHATDTRRAPADARRRRDRR